MAEELQYPPIRATIVQSRYVDRQGEDHEIFGDVTPEWERWFVRLRTIITAAGFGVVKQKAIISAIDELVSPTHTSGVFPVANIAFFIPFTVYEQKIIKRILVPIASLGAGGNLDVGIYTTKKVRLVSSGSVPAMNAMTQAVNIVNETLDPGAYYMTIALDNTAVSIFAVTVNAGVNRQAGVFEKTSSFPLPATGVFNEHATRNYIPRFSLDTIGGQITPTFVGSGTNNAVSGNLIVTPPTTQTNDIMVCSVTARDNVALTFPAGWTIYREGNNGVGLRSTLAWKRATGAEAAFTITHPAGGAIVATVAVYRGCVATGSPINASSLRHNASSATCTADAITPTVPNCLILFTTHSAGTTAASAQAATDPAAFTERFDEAPGLSGADSFNLAGGSTGLATATLDAGANINSGGLTALTPLVK